MSRKVSVRFFSLSILVRDQSIQRFHSLNQSLVKVHSEGLYNEVKGEKFLSHDFTPGGKVEFHHKDLKIALEAAKEYDVSLLVTALVERMFRTLMAKGRGDWDHSALLTLVEELSGCGSGV